MSIWLLAESTRYISYTVMERFPSQSPQECLSQTTGHRARIEHVNSSTRNIKYVRFIAILCVDHPFVMISVYSKNSIQCIRYSDGVEYNSAAPTTALIHLFYLCIYREDHSRHVSLVIPDSTCRWVHIERLSHKCRKIFGHRSLRLVMIALWALRIGHRWPAPLTIGHRWPAPLMFSNVLPALWLALGAGVGHLWPILWPNMGAGPGLRRWSPMSNFEPR